jgi:hypothetical protein
LVVSLAERKAMYTWCGISPDVVVQGIPGSTTSGSDDCYFIDQDGYIFDKAPYFSGEVYFKFYGTPDAPDVPRLDSSRRGTSGGLSTADSDFDPSGSFFSQQHFQQLISLRDILVGLGLKPVSLYVTNDGDIQIFLSSGSASSSGPEILLKLDADYENVAENLEAALTTAPLQSEFKNKYSSLLYIDLRFGNKVYYKFSSSTPTSPTTTTQ